MLAVDAQFGRIAAATAIAYQMLIECKAFVVFVAYTSTEIRVALGVDQRAVGPVGTSCGGTCPWTTARHGALEFGIPFAHLLSFGADFRCGSPAL